MIVGKTEINPENLSAVHQAMIASEHADKKGVHYSLPVHRNPRLTELVETYVSVGWSNREFVEYCYLARREREDATDG